MLTFEQWKQYKGGYVSVKLSEEDSKRIRRFFNDNGVEDIIEDLHVTLMYDVSNPAYKVESLHDKFVGIITGCKLLGEKGSKWGAVTLTLESPDLIAQHNVLSNLGYKHSYPEYIPHLSIKYKPSDEDIQKIEELTKQLQGNKLTFDSFSIDPIKE
jgi:hypothetical protein